MNITEVRVKLVNDSSDRVRAFCSVTLDGEFVIRDLKLIEGVDGMFLAMPSRKLTDRCPKCASKNHVRAQFCNQCGGKLDEHRAGRDSQGRPKLHADIAHPINAECREKLQKALVEAFERERELSEQPDYRPPTLDDDLGPSEYPEDLDEMRESPGSRSAPADSARRPAGAGPGPVASPPPSQQPQAAKRAEPRPSGRKEPRVASPARRPASEPEDPFGAGIL